MPFIQNDFMGFLVFFAALLAILVALMQTFGESMRGTYLFLLHRSASLGWLIGMKLFVGLGTYLIVTAFPLWIYGIWAATPDNFAGPFEWSMTVPAWVTWFAMTILYLGTFLTGIIPGRWYGARFLPLAAAAFILITIALFSSQYAGAIWFCIAVLVVDIWIVILILFVAKSRDYS